MKTYPFRSDDPMATLLAAMRDSGALPEIATVIEASHGDFIETESYEWTFYCRSQCFKYRWSLTNPLLEYLIKSFLQAQAVRTSTRSALNSANAIVPLLTQATSYPELAFASSLPQFRRCLARAFLECRDLLTAKKHLDRFYRLFEFYRWGTVFVGDDVFDIEVFEKINASSIPGNQKGDLVRRDHPTMGALRQGEVQSLAAAVRNDRPANHLELMQKVAVVLCLAIGRNCENYILLRETDLIERQKTPDHPPSFVLLVPRIKKRDDCYRDPIPITIHPKLGYLILELVALNQAADLSTQKRAALDIHVRPRARPLFRTSAQGQMATASNTCWDGFLSPSQFTQLLNGFARRKHLVSERTGELIHLSARRFRYTFASRHAGNGVDRRMLAYLLDHSGTQNVHVYYDIQGKISERLRSAASGRIEIFLDLITGERRLDSIAADAGFDNSESNNGTSSGCETCPAFRRYEHCPPRK